MFINIVWIIVLQLDFTALFNLPCELHTLSPFSVQSSCAGVYSNVVILTSSVSAQYVPVLALHALLICPAIESYTDAGCQRGSAPQANLETISCSQAQYTRELFLYYIWRAHLRRLLHNRSSTYAQPNRQRRVSMLWFYPSDGRVSVFPAPRC